MPAAIFFSDPAGLSDIIISNVWINDAVEELSKDKVFDPDKNASPSSISDSAKIRCAMSISRSRLGHFVSAWKIVSSQRQPLPER